MDLTGIGLRRMLRAIRERNAPLVLLGAALLAVGLARRFDRVDAAPVYSQKLKPGESVKIAVVRPDED